MITGQGLAEAVAGADVLINLTNSPTFDDASPDAVLSWTTEGDAVRLPTTPLQLIAAQDVSDAVAEVAVGAPLNGALDIAEPDVLPLDELGRITLNAHPDGRTVVTDDTAGMFAAVPGDALIAKGDARIAPTRYSDWLS